jgi:hypothetical protein
MTQRDINSEILDFEVRSDLVIIGHNPECADMDNPRGEVYGYTSYVIATTPDGFRWQHPQSFTSAWGDVAEGQAKKLCDQIVAFVKRGGKLLGCYWQEIRPCYGSPEYDRQGIEAQDAADERAEFERW